MSFSQALYWEKQIEVGGEVTQVFKIKSIL